jgi:hypothetical protein
MRVACSKCGLSFETLIIDQHQALKELEAKTINHVKHKHPEIFNPLAEGIQKASMCLARLLHFDECVVVPDNEVWLKDQLMDSQEVVMIAMGYDPNEDEEDEEEELEEGEEEQEEPIEIESIGSVESIDSIPDKEAS